MPECCKKDTCKNYGVKWQCALCWAQSDIYNTHPLYQSKDLVEVVRCKDCKHWCIDYNFCLYTGGIRGAGPNGYCSYGERRGNDDEPLKWFEEEDTDG